MATNNNISPFTASDIEKYHRGLLTPSQMQEMEKAALDDPFLADAIEGYEHAGFNASEDLNDLKNRLKSRTAITPVVSMSIQKKNYNWIRVAALIAVIAGAAIFANQLLFHKKQSGISEAYTPEIKENNIQTPVSPDSEIKTLSSDSAEPSLPKIRKAPPIAPPVKSDVTINTNVSPDEVKAQPVAKEHLERELRNGSAETPGKKSSEVATTDNKVAAASTPVFKNRDAQARQYENDEQKHIQQRKENQYRNNANVFRGRVTDGSNIGVPFANVTNTQDNVGTYTDARGYFNLTSPDTVLDVQVRSIGFENNVARLRNDQPSNQVVLEDDRSLSEVVISKQKPNAAARSIDNNFKLEEPEPIDGWEKYDAYLVNNLKVPEDLKIKTVNEASVELSFEVTKDGEPHNIRIERSLCATCDKEAVRLIKDGPKWKRKAKKSRTRVTITF